MEIIQIVNSIYNSNTFILKQNDRAVLVDVGDIEPILDLNLSRIEAIFITHTHYDHIYGILNLIHYYPDCKIYTSEWGKKALASDKLNYSRYHDDPIICNSKNINVLYKGDKINILNDVVIEVFETPGHDKSCLTYVVGKNMFSGDSYIPGLKVVDKFPHSNKIDAENSLQQIKKMFDDEMNLYPGHGVIYIKIK